MIKGVEVGACHMGGD